MQTISSRQVYENPWMTLREDAVRRADGSEGIYAVVDRPLLAIVIPRDDDGAFHLVEQFRYPLGVRRWEFPMGTAPDGENLPPAELAARELSEETGFAAARLDLLGTQDVSPGGSSQRAHVFLATGLTPGPPRREATEQDMRSGRFPAAEFDAMVLGGEVTDAQSLAAYALLLLHDRR